MRVLAIAGSLRRGSWNRQLLEAARVHAPPEVIVQLHDTLGNLPLFDEDVEAATRGGGPEVERLCAAVHAADALLIATPEYNQSIPGVLKNAIDWLSRPRPETGLEVLSRKPVAVVGATTGPWGTRVAQSHLRHVLGVTGAFVLPDALYLSAAASRFAGSGELEAETRRRLGALLVGFEQWIGRLQPTRA